MLPLTNQKTVLQIPIKHVCDLYMMLHLMKLVIKYKKMSVGVNIW